jgi:hypothetical protein
VAAAGAAVASDDGVFFINPQRSISPGGRYRRGGAAPRGGMVEEVNGHLWMWRRAVAVVGCDEREGGSGG